MSEQYAPGTPVKVTIREQEVLAYAFYGTAEPRLRWYVPNPPWPIETHDPEQDFDTWFLGTQGTNPRPLVVIDPEDEAQVQRLHDLFEAKWYAEHPRKHSVTACASGTCRTDVFQAALKEFANPKPVWTEGDVVADDNWAWMRGAETWERTGASDGDRWDDLLVSRWVESGSATVLRQRSAGAQS